MDPLFTRLLVALALGLLVGLQRERTEDSLAGFRTFPLITLTGAIAGVLDAQLGGVWIFAAGLLALAALLVVGNVVKLRAGDQDPGMTTEVAALFMWVVGGLASAGLLGVAVVMGGLCAVLLHLKEPMEGFAENLSDRDVRSVMQIALIGLVVLPVLPDRAYGPYDVLNPFQIWLMVVLIVGISLASYVIYKAVGARAGTLLGGVLGGLISSTATTASYARRVGDEPGLARLGAVVIMVASTVVYARVFAEVAAAAPGVLWDLGPPLLALAGANLAISLVGFLDVRKSRAQMPEQENPTELKAALVFGALYGVVIFALAAARDGFGDLGVYVVAFLSGLTDVDAITLSTANLVEAGSLEPHAGWRSIVIASLSNLLFKGGIAASLGGSTLARQLAPYFGASLLAGVAVLWLWP